jgi:hypothetical protein
MHASWCNEAFKNLKLFQQIKKLINYYTLNTIHLFIKFKIAQGHKSLPMVALNVPQTAMLKTQFATWFVILDMCLQQKPQCNARCMTMALIGVFHSQISVVLKHATLL